MPLIAIRLEKEYTQTYKNTASDLILEAVKTIQTTNDLNLFYYGH
ncbi:MAG: hypothetical protein RIG62_25575 [Cyclobacteriaceae bacterium]